MLVTYKYSSGDSEAIPSPTKSPKKGGLEKDEVKTFSFWTLVTLGDVLARDPSRRTVQPSVG